MVLLSEFNSVTLWYQNLMLWCPSLNRVVGVMVLNYDIMVLFPKFNSWLVLKRPTTGSYSILQQSLFLKYLRAANHI